MTLLTLCICIWWMQISGGSATSLNDTKCRAVHGVHTTGAMIRHSAILSLVLNQGHQYQLLSAVACEAAALLISIAITHSKCRVLCQTSHGRGVDNEWSAYAGDWPPQRARPCRLTCLAWPARTHIPRQFPETWSQNMSWTESLTQRISMVASVVTE